MSTTEEKIQKTASTITNMMKASKQELKAKLYTHSQDGLTISIDGNHRLQSLKLPTPLPNTTDLESLFKQVYDNIQNAIDEDVRKDLMAISKAIGNIKDENAS